MARFNPPPSFLSSPAEGGLRRGLAEGRRAEKKSKRASGKGFSGARAGGGWAREEGGLGCFIGRVRQKAREGERARRLSGDQSIGRFSPCFFVNSSAFFKNFLRSFEYSSARSALRGCSGWGSFTSAMRD